MIRWESIIAKKMRPCAKMADDVAHQRKLEYERKREATPERRAQHRAYDKTEAGRASMARRNKKMPSAVTIALQDIGYMTVHLVRSAAA